MTIIELTELQFKNYSLLHSRRNYKQTVEYANMEENYHYEKTYLGLLDEDNNIHAASLILKKDNMAIAPDGFLVNYNDISLFKIFTNELKNYLKEKKIVFLRTNPLIKYKVFDENNNVIYFDNNLITTFNDLGYKHLGFTNSFKRFNAIMNTDNDIANTYKKFNRNTKRNIEKATEKSISIHRGNSSNLELFYSLIKSKNNLEYYRNYLKYFNNFDNHFELYFAKLESMEYLNNYRYLLRKEQENNWELQSMMQDNSIKKTNNLLNKKILSDKLVNNYNNEVIRATNIYKNYPNGLIIGTCAIIKNNKEIFFLEDGYEEKLKDIHSSHMLKWEIIKKYINEGYNTFNFGYIPYNRTKENNEYYGLYLSKIGFGANIVEFPGEFDLVINKAKYNLYINSENFKKIIKKNEK